MQEINFKFLKEVFRFWNYERKNNQGGRNENNSWVSQVHFPMHLDMLVSKYEYWKMPKGHMKKMTKGSVCYAVKKYIYI